MKDSAAQSTTVDDKPPPTSERNGEVIAKQEKTVVRASTVTNSESNFSTTTTISNFPELHFTYRGKYVAFYVSFLILCNLVIPCLLFYPLEDLTNLTDTEIIGISSAALGISSCFDAPFRLYRLVRYRSVYGPLGNDTWWYLDFTMWTYTFALFVFAVPLAIAPAIPLFNFFLMSTVCLVGPIGLVFLISLFRPKMPFRCSSDPSGVRMKPAVFYLIEDVASVDFMHGREFRAALYRRWEVSPPWRRLMRILTVYWTISIGVYCGVTAAVSWCTPLRFAFAWTLAQLFVWGGVSLIGSVFLAKWGMRVERRWCREQGIHRIEDPKMGKEGEIIV